MSVPPWVSSERRFRRGAKRCFLVVLLVAMLAALWHGLPVAPVRTLYVNTMPSNIQFSPDGRLLGTEARDQEGNVAHFRQWDVFTGEERFCLTPSPERYTHVTYSGDGMRLLVERRSDLGNSFRLLDCRTGEPWITFEVLNGSFLLSQDGAKVTCTSDRTIEPLTAEVWDVAARHKLFTLKPIGRPAAYSPDGRFLLTYEWKFGLGFYVGFSAGPVSPPAAKHDQVQVWDLADGTLQAHWRIPTDGRVVWEPVRYAPDGRSIAVAASVNGVRSVKVYDAETLEERSEVAADDQIEFAGGGRVLATANGVRQGRCDVHLWDVATGQPLAVAPVGPARGSLQYARLTTSPTGPAVAVVLRSDVRPGAPWKWLPDRLCRWLHAGTANDGEVVLLDSATGSELRRVPGRIAGDPAFSPDGRLLAVAREDGRVELWDVPPRKPLGVFLGASAALLAPVAAVAWWRRRGGHQAGEAMGLS